MISFIEFAKMFDRTGHRRNKLWVIDAYIALKEKRVQMFYPDRLHCLVYKIDGENKTISQAIFTGCRDDSQFIAEDTIQL